MATAIAPPPELTSDEAVVDLTTPEFFAMIEAGFFPPDRRVFLWNGRLCEKMAKTAAHATTSVAIHQALTRRLPDGWLLWPENPIALDARHAPLPDVTIVRGPLSRFVAERRHPAPGDVGLIVEIAVSSLPRDLGERAEKFARALVPRYWVADVRGGTIVEHSDPEIVEGVGHYALVKSRSPGEEIVLVLDGRAVAGLAVAELLPWSAER